MTLLDFARGPALYWSLIILVGGIVWRLVGIFLLPHRKDLSESRHGEVVSSGIRAVISRSLPAKELEHKVRFQHYTGYAWHIGLFVTVLFFQPHIEFFKNIFGFGWPGLPNGVITWVAVIALAILIMLLVRRMLHPVMRLITTIGDYVCLGLVILPLITGLMATAHVGLRYETMLAVHILSVEAMFVWLPFGKLMHVFLVIPARFNLGAFFWRKGVRA